MDVHNPQNSVDTLEGTNRASTKQSSTKVNFAVPPTTDEKQSDSDLQTTTANAAETNGRGDANAIDSEYDNNSKQALKSSVSFQAEAKEGLEQATLSGADDAANISASYTVDTESELPGDKIGADNTDIAAPTDDSNTEATAGVDGGSVTTDTPTADNLITSTLEPEAAVATATATTTSRPSTPIPDNTVELVIRPRDKEWAMGEDWVVRIPYTLTLNEIRDVVEKEKGICKHRIQLRLKGKILPSSREDWTLRRYGIYDGYVIQVEPTMSGTWLWHDLDWYTEKLLGEVIEEIRKSENSRIKYSVLESLIPMPPCFKFSLRVFLRKYPERVYIHTDITENIMWVLEPSRSFQLPTFSNFPIEIGHFKHYEPAKFNWNAYKDVDDMYQQVEFEATLPSRVLDGDEANAGAEGDENKQSSREVKTQEEIEREAALAAGDDDNEEDEGDGGAKMNADSSRKKNSTAPSSKNNATGNDGGGNSSSSSNNGTSSQRNSDAKVSSATATAGNTSSKNTANNDQQDNSVAAADTGEDVLAEMNALFATNDTTEN